jgi:glutamate--cysteine ligase
MSLDAKQSAERSVTSIDDLLKYFHEAEKRDATLLVGLEHERLVYPIVNPQPVAYDGPNGIGAMLKGFKAFGWEEFKEGETVIAMTRANAQLSLEPGGQFELSGAPATTARAVQAENLKHVAEARQVLASLGLRAVTLGYRPFDSIPTMPWMPKLRYRMMRQTLGSRGRYAHAMMLMTATGQVSLDWRDEADCARKVTLSAKLSPLLVALYANSPLVEGEPCGYASFRSHVWSDVDNARCGYLPSMIDGSFSYRAYVEWALDAPMLFLRRRGEYLSPRFTFRQLLAEGFEGKPALYDDWVDHLSTLFPEVRIKRVLEIRSADGVSAAMTGALAALMRGLLYDTVAHDELDALLKPRSFAAHLEQHVLAQREGLAAKWGSGTLNDLARELVAISRRALQRLDPEDVGLLAPLEERTASGRSPSVDVLEAPRNPAALYERFAL